MRFAENFPALAMLPDRLINRAPRIAAVFAIAMVWALTLAWPLPAVGSRPLVAGAQDVANSASYPLRLALPESKPVSAKYLARLSERHSVIANLDLDSNTPAGRQEPRSGTSMTSQFASAFAAFLDPSGSRASEASARAATDLAPGEILALDYDLAALKPSQPASAVQSGKEPRYDAADGSLTVSKQLLVDGKSKGNATIRIEEGAQILIATASVADALGPRAEGLPSRISGALATRSGFIPFHELRGAGIAVEYDPVTDRVSLSTPS